MFETRKRGLSNRRLKAGQEARGEEVNQATPVVIRKHVRRTDGTGSGARRRAAETRDRNWTGVET